MAPKETRSTKTTSKATAKKSSKTTKKAVCKNTRRSYINVYVKVPGMPDAKERIVKGSTLKQFINERNAGDYAVAVNGKPGKNSYKLEKDDVIAFGTKDKNG